MSPTRPSSTNSASATTGDKAARLVRTTTFRVALVYLALVGASVLVLLGFLYWSTAGFMAHQTDATIEAEIRGLAEQYDQFGTIGLVRALDRRTGAARSTRGLYLLTDPAFRPIAGNLTAWPREEADAEGWVTFRLEYADARGAGDRGRARTFTLAGGLHLLVGRDIRERLEIADRIRWSMGWGLALAVALSLAGGILISRPLLRRLESINATSREIMAGELDRRIPLSGTGDEFDRLAGNLNAMLDRIAELLAGIREVSDNIAHDLRSPLARLRSRLELTLAEAGDEAAYRRAIERTIEDADQLLKTFNALLSIARIEAGAAPRRFEPFDIGRLIEDVAELYAPLAEERRVGLTVAAAEPASVSGDRNLVFQCVANLLDNAIKYSPEGAAVDIACRREGGGLAVSIADRGPGIADDHKGRVTDRFYRVESSRSAPGSGLGLSLAAAIAKLHGAALALEDNDPGLRVVLRLPGERVGPPLAPPSDRGAAAA